MHYRPRVLYTFKYFKFLLQKLLSLLNIKNVNTYTLIFGNGFTHLTSDSFFC